MAQEFNIIEYMSGLTGFVVDEAILKRIAMDRDVDWKEYADLTERDKDLLQADILYTVLISPSTLPSFQHQHGQFSMSIGQQPIKDKDSLWRIVMRLYKKWGDSKAEEVPQTSGLEWHM